MKTITSSTKKHGYAISSRVDRQTYQSIIGLLSTAGYTDISSFIKQAVLSQCKGIAQDLTEFIDKELTH